MSKVSLLAVAGLLGLSVSLSAQELPFAGRVQFARSFNRLSPGGGLDTRPTLGQADFFAALNNGWNGPPPLTLADGRIFSFPSAFAWMETAPLGLIPAAILAEPPRVTQAAMRARTSTSTPVDLLPRLDYVGGEVGAFYGRSTGKFGLEVKGGYIMSDIIEGNTHISVGASYEESSGRLPRFGR